MPSSSVERDCGEGTVLISNEDSGIYPKESKNNGNKMHVSRGRKVAIMLACMYLSMSCFGVFVALGVIYVELISNLHSQRSDAALVQGLYLGLSLCGGIFVTRIITKYDTGFCVMVASTIASVAMACSSLAVDIGTVIALVGVVTGLSTSVSTISSNVVINWTFVNNRKFALSILTLGSSVGQTVLPLITDVLVEKYTWRGALLILSALSFLNCIPCGLIICTSKRFYKIEQDRASNNKVSIKSYLIDCAFILYVTTVFLYTTVGPVESWFIVDMAVLKGFGMQSGTVLLSMNGLFGFLGRIVCTIVLKYYPNTRPELHMSYGYIAFAAAHFSITMSTVYTLAFLGMVLRGLSSAIIIGFFASLQLELRGSESFPHTIAITNMVFGIGDIVGGYIGGYSADVTGSYNLIFYVSAACALYSALCMFIIYFIFRRRKRRSGQYQPLS